MKSVLLEEMSWLQVKNALEAGYKSVIIAAGSIEQHGPHLPEGTDTYLGYAGAESLAKELGNTLVAPTIRPGISGHHMAFPGSLTLRPSTFLAIVEDYVNSYIHHGFENIILFPSHGGNFKALNEFTEKAQEKHPNIKIICAGDHESHAKLRALAEKEDGIPEAIDGVHAGNTETSRMLYFHPHLVDMSVVEAGMAGEFTEEMRERLHAEGMKSVSENGILGDGRNANEKQGKKSHERLVKYFAKIIREKLAL